MTPKQIVRKRLTLESKEKQISIDLQNLRDICPHENLTGENHGDSGNWSRSDDSYWCVFTCQDCGKRWSEDQEDTYYDRVAKCNRTSNGLKYTLVNNRL